MMFTLEEFNGEFPNHVSWDYYPMGIGGSISKKKANEIIEKITAILINEKITVYVATQILEDTINAIKKEALLEKRVIGGKII